MRTRHAFLSATLCLAGCGTNAERPPPQPTLPRPLALALAERSDAVAKALEAGDACRALTLAQRLQRQTVEAINAGRIVTPLQEPLQSAVNQLAGRIQCVAPPAEEERGKHKGKGKKKHGRGDE